VPVNPGSLAAQLARESLLGLSVGDALGARWEGTAFNPLRLAEDPAVGEAPIRWTDDTQMAVSIVDELLEHGTIDCDRLATAFARRYEPWRGYGRGMHSLLPMLRDGGDWRVHTTRLFPGGSYGNGSAMRVAPLGVFFHDRPLEQVVAEAERSAEVTHAHPEARAGAAAVAVASWLAARSRGVRAPAWDELWATVVEPLDPTQKMVRGLGVAAELGTDASLGDAVFQLGNGARVTCDISQVCGDESVPPVPGDPGPPSSFQRSAASCGARASGPRRRPSGLRSADGGARMPRRAMATTTRRATEDDLWNAPEDGNKYELVDGELQMSPAGARHGQVCVRLTLAIGSFVRERRLGEVFDSSTGFRLPGGNVRLPDVSFVPTSRLSGRVSDDFSDALPALAIEVLSPSDRARLVLDKVGEYLQAGVQLVWVVDPRRERAAVYRSLTDVCDIGIDGTLDGGDVLPGFAVALRALLA
jgi:ADP-ribosylglycohydrolase/Uma2 family endonuclease